MMKVNFTIPEIIYLFAAFQGIFLASLILVKRVTKGNVFLFLLILLFSFYLFENVIYSSGYLVELPHLFLATLPLIFLIGPLFYQYIRSSLNKDFRLRPLDVVHLFPFLFELIILVPFYRLDENIKILVYERSQVATTREGISIFFVGYLIFILSTFWYFFASYRLLKSHSISNTKSRKRLKWLRLASATFFSYMFFSLILSIWMRIAPEITPIYFHVNLILMSLMVYGIGYVSYLNPDLFDSLSKKSIYTFSALDEVQMELLANRLTQLMTNEQPYLKSDITAEDISKSLDISKHQLSQVLSLGLQSSFYELVNHYRVEHSKTILTSPEYDHAKILHIAFDSGFTNKASFLRNFKKYTGQTPTTFRNLARKEVSIN